MADIGGLQLLPETRKKIEVYVPGQNRLLKIGFLVVIIVAILYGGLFYYRSRIQGQVSDLDNQLTALENSRDKTAEKDLLAYRQYLGLAKPLLQSHIAWSVGMDRFQKLIQPQIQFESLAVNSSKGEYSFQAKAANYMTIARQIAAFYSDPNIQDVALGRVTGLSDGKASFSIKVIFDMQKILMPLAASLAK